MSNKQSLRPLEYNLQNQSNIQKALKKSLWIRKSHNHYKQELQKESEEEWRSSTDMEGAW